MISSLSGVGLTITEHAELPAEVPEGSTVLVLDEVFSPVILSTRDNQLAMIQELMRRRCRLLWVTSGGHMNVTNPELSLFVGILRSLLAEDPTCLVMTVDIESSTSFSSTQAILQTMRDLESVDNVEFVEREWVERGGVPYVSRVVPNLVINKAEENDLAAAEPVVKTLFGDKPVTRLINTSIGIIEDVGYFTDSDTMAARLLMQGWTPINEALLHRILRISLLQQSANPVDPDSTAQVITGIPNPLGPNSPQKPVHRFSALRPRTAADGDGAGDSDLALLRGAAHGQGADIEKATLLAAAVSAVNGVLTMSLGLTEPLEPTRPLKTYGIDSLVPVELRNWIRTEISIELSALEIVGAVTLVTLCEVILKKLQRWKGTGSRTYRTLVVASLVRLA